MTPMIVRGPPSASYVRPMTDGSPPNHVVHSAWLRVAAEPRRPHRVADDHHAVLVLLHRQPPEPRLGAERREEGVQRRGHADALDAVVQAESARERVVPREVLDEGRLAVGDHELRGDAELVGEAGAGRRGADVHEAVGVRERQRLEEHRVHDAEHPRVHADGEPQRPDGHRGEPGRAAERARGLAELLDPHVHRRHSPVLRGM
jgi:hypothetical protein